MKFNDWLSALGNIGLIVSLGLVAWQVHLSSRIAEIQVQHESMMGLRDMYLHAAGEELTSAFAVALEDPASLTTQQIQSLDYYARAHAYHIIRVSRITRAGYDTGSSDVGLAVVFAYEILTTRWGLSWWDVNRDWITTFAPEIGAEVDRLSKL